MNRTFIAGTSCSLNRTQDKIYDKVQIQNNPPPSVCTAAPLLCRFLGKVQCLLGSSPLQNGRRWPSLLEASKPASEANRTSDKKYCKYKDQIHARWLDSTAASSVCAQRTARTAHGNHVGYVSSLTSRRSRSHRRRSTQPSSPSDQQLQEILESQRGLSEHNPKKKRRRCQPFYAARNHAGWNDSCPRGLSRISRQQREHQYLCTEQIHPKFPESECRCAAIERRVHFIG